MNNDFRKSERGSAGTKLLFYLMIFALILNAGINYVPVAYNAESFKQEMQTAVTQGMVLPPSSGNPVEITKKRIGRAAVYNDLPENFYVEVKQANGSIQARVIYNKQVSILPFGIYNYDYKFDHTSNSRGFLSEDSTSKLTK